MDGLAVARFLQFATSSVSDRRAYGLNASPKHRSQGWVRHPGLQFRRNRSMGQARRTIRQRRAKAKQGTSSRSDSRINMKTH
jgi:hypothetical protein